MHHNKELSGPNSNCAELRNPGVEEGWGIRQLGDVNLTVQGRDNPSLSEDSDNGDGKK